MGIRFMRKIQGKPQGMGSLLEGAPAMEKVLLRSKDFTVDVIHTCNAGLKLEESLKGFLKELVPRR